MATRVYVCDASHSEELKKLLAYDPYLDKSLNEEQLAKVRTDPEANVIFVRQDYVLKEGAAYGLDSQKCYLYLKAQDDFLDQAEKKLKKLIQGLQRASKGDEDKVSAAITEERSAAEQGLGSIFGG